MVRIQKYLSDCGVMSRRAAEKAIERGEIEINGIKAQIGDKIDENGDAVTYLGKPVERQAKKLYILLNKPAGYVTTMSDELGRKTVSDLLKDVPARVYPVGRLDKNSEGALICTNDGEFANRLMHPSGMKKKVYLVYVRGNVSNNAISALQSMKALEDGEPIAPVKVILLQRSPDFSILRFELIQGKNRQIRRMCERCSLSIMQLRRISIGGIQLGELASGKWRALTKEEKDGIMKNDKSSSR